MPARLAPIITEHYYHVFNRGVARMPIFYSVRDYHHMLRALEYYRFAEVPIRLSFFSALDNARKVQIIQSLESAQKTLITVVAYVLMPNHFHLLLRQNQDNGIATYVARSINSYARYINTKRKRVGPLFQGVYKAVRVESNEQLLHLSRYIHLNPFLGGIEQKERLFGYPWSSLQAYLGKAASFVRPDIVLEQFFQANQYETFVSDHADFVKRQKEIAYLIQGDEGITEV